MAAVWSRRFHRVLDGRAYQAGRLGQLARSSARKNRALCGVQLKRPRRKSFGTRGLGEAVERSGDAAVCDQKVFERRRQLESVEVSSVSEARASARAALVKLPSLTVGLL